MLESRSMVKIRLTRTGKKHEPHYRIVAVDSRTKRDGKYIEKIGYYNPRTKPPTLEYDKEILQKWIDQGAQMTDTIFDIFVKEGIVKKSKIRTKRVELMIKRSKDQKEAEQTTEKKEETPKEEPKETEQPPEEKAEKQPKTDEKEEKDTTEKSAQEKTDPKQTEEKKPEKDTETKAKPSKDAESEKKKTEEKEQEENK